MPRRKVRSKGITLPEEGWLRNSKEIKNHREQLLSEQDGKCAISEVPLLTGALDHDHTTGHIRGVLLNEVNLLEGRYLKLFNKLKLKEKYGIDFPTFLVNMGEYLKQDYSDNLIHHRHMEDFRKKVNRMLKPKVAEKLEKEYGIVSNGDKAELVRLYVEAWLNENY